MDRAQLSRLLAEPSSVERQRKLSAWVETQPDLAVFDERNHVFADSAPHWTLQSLVTWLVNQADTYGPEEAARHLDAYLGTETIEHELTLVIGGAEVDRTVELESGITVYPFEELPASTWKASIEADQATGTRPIHLEPVAGLVCRREFPKRIVSDSREIEFLTDTHRELEDVRLLLGICGQAAPFTLGAWSTTPPWIPKRGAAAKIKHLHDIGPAYRWSRSDVSVLPSVYRAWLTRHGEERDHLRVALERLNRAMRYWADPVSSFIDLGTALEGLFLTDRQADRGELSFTLRLRAGRYLGESPDERYELSRHVNVLYHLRSRAVHTGRLPDEYKGTRLRDLAEGGYRLTGRAAYRLIESGTPDWKRVVFR